MKARNLKGPKDFDEFVGWVKESAVTIDEAGIASATLTEFLRMSPDQQKRFLYAHAKGQHAIATPGTAEAPRRTRGKAA